MKKEKIKKKKVSKELKNKKAKVKPAKVEKKLTEEVKKEKWYKGLKTDLLENEKEFSKEYRRSRNLIAIFAFLCFISVLLATSFIDYTRAFKGKTQPYFAIRARNEYKQATVYYGVFYKAWICDSDKNRVNFGSFSSSITNCKVVVAYDDDGYYENAKGLKISKEQMNTIQPYYSDYFNGFETEEELEQAYKVSSAINKVRWVQKSTGLLLEDNTIAYLAIFNKLVENTWELQYSDPAYYKCVKSTNGIYTFSDYNSEANKCGSNWEALKLSDDICEIATKDITYVRELVKITNLCD